MAIRPITDTLRMIDSGVFVDIASEKLNQLIKRVDDTGKSGKLTITPEFNFSTENPNQQKLDLRQVDTTPTEMREAATGAGPLRSAS
jgi:hypothetical protein